MNIIIGNMIALIASLLMVYTGIIKKKEKIIYFQTVQIILSIISNIILGGITGAIINGISCIRNILYYKNKLRVLEKLIIIILSIILSLLFNNLGIIGLLPLISIVMYTILIDIKDVIKFKVLIIFTMIMWFIYDITIKSYTASFFDFSTIIINIIAILELKYRLKSK